MHDLPVDDAVLNRASGVLIGQACGDALGVPYEFATPPGRDEEPEMRGGGLGPYAPGEWSDDTQMASCIARVLARGTDPDLDAIATEFMRWRTGGASDIGMQTAAVIDGAARQPGTPAQRLRAAAWRQYADTGRAAGNGALMRTAVVGLVALDDRGRTAQVAAAVAELTHADPLAAESCVLWSEAVRVAVCEGRLNLRDGLDLLTPERAGLWSMWIDEAEQEHPRVDLSANGFTVTALQAAWHVLFTVPGYGPSADPDERARLFTGALAAAVRIGGDTDTVAAITGGLVGAYVGFWSIPRELRRAIHGWPGVDGRALGAWGRLIAQGGSGTGGQVCPICGTETEVIERYPHHVCVWCAEFVTDEEGRPVELYNTSFGGGYTGLHPDGSLASDEVLAGRVWIDGAEYRAQAARFGGTVVQRKEHR